MTNYIVEKIKITNISPDLQTVSAEMLSDEHMSSIEAHILNVADNDNITRFIKENDIASRNGVLDTIVEAAMTEENGELTIHEARTLTLSERLDFANEYSLSPISDTMLGGVYALENEIANNLDTLTQMSNEQHRVDTNVAINRSLTDMSKLLTETENKLVTFIHNDDLCGTPLLPNETFKFPTAVEKRELADAILAGKLTRENREEYTASIEGVTDKQLIQENFDELMNAQYAKYAELIKENRIDNNERRTAYLESDTQFALTSDADAAPVSISQPLYASLKNGAIDVSTKPSDGSIAIGATVVNLQTLLYSALNIELNDDIQSLSRIQQELLSDTSTRKEINEVVEVVARELANDAASKIAYAVEQTFNLEAYTDFGIDLGGKKEMKADDINFSLAEAISALENRLENTNIMLTQKIDELNTLEKTSELTS